MHPSPAEIRVFLRTPQHRQYALWVGRPRTFPNRTYPRTYNPQTILLKDKYLSLLNTGRPLLFLKHKDFKANGLIKLRRDVASTFSARHADPSKAEDDGTGHILGVRTAVFGVALREYVFVDDTARFAIKKMIGKGALFVLTLPSIDPIHLSNLMNVLQRAVPRKKKPPTPEEVERAKADANADFVPGKRQINLRPIKTPELELVGALVNSRPLFFDDVKLISKLPPLEYLHSQIARSVLLIHVIYVVVADVAMM